MNVKVTYSGKSIADIRNGAKKVLSEAPRAAGVIAVNHFKANFEKGGFDDDGVKKWPARKNNSDSGRPVLVKATHLRDAIRIAVTTADSVKIADSMPYADIHNRGGTTHPNVTDKMRKYAWMMLKKTKDEMWRGIALTKKKKKKLTVKIQKRQFIGKSRSLGIKIQDWIKNRMNKELHN